MRTSMASSKRQQLLISGVGGQGVLFVTRLLAEAAIAKGLPVFTCETHGMAQRGGTVVSHLKVGNYHSPLVRAGQADGLLVLKSENLAQHGAFLKPGGWVVANAGSEQTYDVGGAVFAIEADRLAQETGNVRSINLVVLGFALSVAEKMKGKAEQLFCTLADIEKTVKNSFNDQPKQLSVFLNAIRSGYDAPA